MSSTYQISTQISAEAAATRAVASSAEAMTDSNPNLHQCPTSEPIVRDGIGRREVPKPKKLGEILQRRRLVSGEALQQTIQQQAQHPLKLGELLVRHNVITPTDLQQALKEQAWRRQGFWVLD
jgi:hypothetical protein